MSQDQAPGGEPAGEVYDWYVRALELLDGGNPEAAASLLAHARAREPGSASLLEAMARAQFDARRYASAAEHFAELAAASPDSDYAQFGLGLSRMRLGDHEGAVEHLAIAVAMRPHRKEYDDALRQARATLRFREQGVREPDAGEPDLGEPEAGEPDLGEPEAGEPDLGAPGS